MISKLNAKLDDRRKRRGEVATIAKEAEQLLEEVSDLKNVLAVHWDYEIGMDTLQVTFKYTIDENSFSYEDEYTHGFTVLYPSEHYPTLSSFITGLEEALVILVNEAFMLEYEHKDTK